MYGFVCQQHTFLPHFAPMVECQLPGTGDQNGKEANETVVIGAHFDSRGVSRLFTPLLILANVSPVPAFLSPPFGRRVPFARNRASATPPHQERMTMVAELLSCLRWPVTSGSTVSPSLARSFSPLSPEVSCRFTRRSTQLLIRSIPQRSKDCSVASGMRSTFASRRRMSFS